LKLPAKLQLLRQEITEKEEMTNGEYDIDIARYFKLLSSDVGKTIFEEEWRKNSIHSSNKIVKKDRNEVRTCSYGTLRCNPRSWSGKALINLLR
jgi:hypothetical protein